MTHTCMQDAMNTALKHWAGKDVSSVDFKTVADGVLTMVEDLSSQNQST